MKRLILLVFLCILNFTGYSQNSLFGIYGGAGTSLKYNYDVGLSGGFNFTKIMSGRTGLGATLFYQGYAFLYDQEAYSAKNGTGNAGMTILNKSSYIFVAPKLSQFFGKHGTLEAYLNAGAGFKMSGTEDLRKWDRSHGSVNGDYDSLLNTSDKINGMLLRVGVGLTEYIHLGKGNWWFTVTEDFGFLASSITKTSDANYASRTQYSPQGKLNPSFISLHIGIAHSKVTYSSY